MCFTDCDDDVSSVCIKEYRCSSRRRCGDHHRRRRRGSGSCSGSSSSSSDSNDSSDSPTAGGGHENTCSCSCSPVRPPPRCYSPRRCAAPPRGSYTSIRRSRCRTVEESLIPIRVERPPPARWVDVRAYRCVPAVECFEILEPEECLVRRRCGGGRVWEMETDVDVEVEYIPARC